MKLPKLYPIPGYDGYSITKTGRIFSKRGLSLKELKPQLNRGYFRVGLMLNGKGVRRTVHRLVLLTFVGDPKPEQTQSCHLDGKTTNNSLKNLCWGTQSENESHKRVHGTAAIGENNPNRKLTEDQVLAIRREYKRYTYHHTNIYELMDKYKMSKVQIARILRKRAWPHI